MNDPRGAFLGRDQKTTESERAQTSELMRQALTAINQGQIPGGVLTAESVEQLARNIGVNDPEQIATLQRMMMLTPASMTEAVAAQHILFMLDEVECALPSNAVQGVERQFDVTPVPNVVPWVLGVSQMWGSIISLVDLRGFMGLPTIGITPRSRLLAVVRREMTIGFVVDVVTEIRTIGDAIQRERSAGAPAWLQPFLEGVAQVDGRQVYALDPDLLLFSERMSRYRAD